MDDDPPSTGVSIENLQDAPVDTEESSVLVTAVLRAEEYPSTSQVTVVYVDDETMTGLNREHLGGEGPTDVISLPLEHMIPGRVPPMAGVGPPLVLGDILIAPSTVARRAVAIGEDADDEMALMVVHGMYHLLGWDHDDDPAAEAMEQREREILEGVGRSRR